MKKGQKLITQKGKVYTVAGRADRDLVLVPDAVDDDLVLIYSPGELQDAIKEGNFRLA